MSARQLRLSWSVSRGRETYGYNICRLDDMSTGERMKCMGGGYDMVGTVFGMWLAEAYGSSIILDLKDRADDFYGLSVSTEGRLRLDGACGLESMLPIAKAIGLQVKRLYNRKGVTTGWIVSDDQAASA